MLLPSECSGIPVPGNWRLKPDMRPAMGKDSRRDKVRGQRS